MRIVIIGAGGIGGWLGAHLSASGQQVGFLVHGRTLAALRSGGLMLRDCSGGEPGTVTARIETPLASDDPVALTGTLGGDPDLVFVTTKVDALPQLAPALRRLTGSTTGVVSTQNGISAPELLADAVGKEHVLPGVARVYSAIISPGTVGTVGNTGSLALGGAVAGLSILTRTEFLAVILGGLFLAEVMSDIIQIVSFKSTGRRVFRMAPLHHHFELGGWTEVNVVIRFWIIAGLCVIAGLGLFYAEYLRQLIFG